MVIAPAAALLALTAAAGLDAPLGVRTPGTFRELFLDVTSADARAPGAAGWEARWLLANDWSTPTTLVRDGRRVELRNDEQADALSFTLRLPWGSGEGGAGPRPLRARISTALEARATAHWGGYTDGVVEAWHHFGHYTNFERERFARDEVHIALRELGVRTLVARDAAGIAPGDVTLRNQVLLADGGTSAAGAASRWGVSARLDVKLPVGSLARAGGSGGADAAVALLGTAELASWLTGHALAGASAWSRLPDGFPLQPRRWHATFEASLASHFGGYAIMVEDRLLSPVFEGGWRYDASDGYELPSSATYASLRWHNQITVGVRRGPFTMWFSEDFTPGARGGPTARWFYDSNAPDVVLGLALVGAL